MQEAVRDGGCKSLVVIEKSLIHVPLASNLSISSMNPNPSKVLFIAHSLKNYCLANSNCNDP